MNMKKTEVELYKGKNFKTVNNIALLGYNAMLYGWIILKEQELS